MLRPCVEGISLRIDNLKLFFYTDSKNVCSSGHARCLLQLRGDMYYRTDIPSCVRQRTKPPATQKNVRSLCDPLRRQATLRSPPCQFCAKNCEQASLQNRHPEGC